MGEVGEAGPVVQGHAKPSVTLSPCHLVTLSLARGAVAGVLLAIAWHAVYVLAGSNFRTVIPGEVYRCAQPTGRDLERLSRRHGIRTVVNLCGCCPSGDWYQDEADATARLGISQEDIHLSALRLPSRRSVRQLVEVLLRSQGPILLHCQQG